MKAPKEIYLPTSSGLCEKCSGDDTFIEGMMEVRQISEHVIRRQGPLIRTIENAPIQLTVESSAMAVFAGLKLTLQDTKGAFHTIDHLRMLEEAVWRITGALARARG